MGVSSTFSGSLLKRYDGQHTLDMTETDEGEDCSGIVNGQILFSVTKMGTQTNNKQRYSQGHHSTPCCACVHGGNFIVGIAHWHNSSLACLNHIIMMGALSLPFSLYLRQVACL